MLYTIRYGKIGINMLKLAFNKLKLKMPKRES